MNARHMLLSASFALACLGNACGDDDEATAPGDAGDGRDTGAASCEPRSEADAVPPEPATCSAREGDYAPCTEDGYPTCISDDGEYHRVEETISTIGRVQAFEEIAELLFDPTAEPSRDEFVMARRIYQEAEGLDSRVVRRYDPHFEVPEGTDCTLPDVPDMFPDYCVGPAQLQPILLDATTAGIAGEAPREQAGRIEAALAWFLYVSTFKESLTCTTTARDCDSAYAYYTGGAPARGGLGLARLIQEVDPYAHDRAWDGALAVRCWRDLDAGETARDLELRDRAREQYDRALIDGVAALVADRLERLEQSSGDEQRYHFGFVTVLGRALDHAARQRDEGAADALASALDADAPAEVDAAQAREAIDAAFDCP